MVEMDIHVVLLDVLEIYWRGCSVTQRLDYLGIPLCFSSCHQTDHLWCECTGAPEEEES